MVTALIVGYAAWILKMCNFSFQFGERSLMRAEVSYMAYVVMNAGDSGGALIVITGLISVFFFLFFYHGCLKRPIISQEVCIPPL